MAVVKEIILEIDNTGAVTSIKEVTEGINQAEDASKDFAETNKNTKKSLGGLTLGVKALGASLKAAGIGLIVAAFAKLKDLFMTSQPALDAVNTAWTALTIVFKDAWNAIMNFDSTLASIGDTIKKIIVERFKTALEAVTSFGNALVSLLSGDLDAALEQAENGIKKLILPGPELSKAAKGWIDYGKSIYETADAYTELNNQARLAEAQLRRVFEQSDRDAEIQRRIRDDFNKTFEERLAASEELARILDEQEETQLRLAGLEVERAQQAIKINGDNIENQIALTNALAEQDAIEADIAGRRAEQEAQDRMLRQEILTARQEEIDTFKSIELDKLEVVRQSATEQAEARLKGAMAETEAERQQSEARKAIAQAEAEAKEAALGATAQALTNLTLIAGKETAAGKALAIAAALISTYTGIAASLKEGGLFGIAQAVAVGAAGFAAVKNIIDTPVPNEGGAKQSAPSAPAAPSFNVVGTSPVNQIAETINQDQEPVQAFVVGSNVTTQQELDRNIVETATLG